MTKFHPFKKTLTLAAGLCVLAAPALATEPETAMQYIATQSYVTSAISLTQGLNSASKLDINADHYLLAFLVHHSDREIQTAQRELRKLQASGEGLGQNQKLQQTADNLLLAHTINQEIVSKVSHLEPISDLVNKQLKAMQAAGKKLREASSDVGMQPLPNSNCTEN